MNKKKLNLLDMHIIFLNVNFLIMIKFQIMEYNQSMSKDKIIFIIINIRKKSLRK